MAIQTVTEAHKMLIDNFPFKDYITSKIKNIDIGAYHDVVTIAEKHLDRKSKILDFGSGACDKTALLQYMGYECSAIDDLQDDWHRIPGNIEKIINFTKSVGIDFKITDGINLPFEKGAFDMIMLHHVLEHLHDSPKELLNSLLELAKPEGLLFITVPNAVNIRKRIDVLRGRTNLPRFDTYYWYPGSWRGHVREYVYDDLQKLAEFLGLEILEIRGCDHMTGKLSDNVRKLYLSITKLFPTWKDSLLLVARKKRGWKPKTTLPFEEFHKIIGKTTGYNYSD